MHWRMCVRSLLACVCSAYCWATSSLLASVRQYLQHVRFDKVEKSQGILPFSCMAHTCHVALSHFAYAPCIFGSSAEEN